MIRGKTSGDWPEAMITFSPPVVASRAASSLLAIPPLLSPPRRSRTSAKNGRIEPVDRRNHPAARLTRDRRRKARRRRKAGPTAGADQVGDDGRQPIVVAEGGLQLLDRHRVVLVDDRHGAKLEQRHQRVAGVQIAEAMFKVLGRQQHLGRMAAMAVQRLLVGLDQGALADGGHGLKLGNIGGAFFQSQPAHAGSDGPGTDQHHFPARRHGVMDLVGELLDSLGSRADRPRG